MNTPTRPKSSTTSRTQGRTKGSLLDHIAIPVTAFFVATDLMTVHLYTESLFDERPEMAMLVAASIALLLDACPMVAGKLKGQLDDMLPHDQRATKRRISALLGTAVGAFAIFAGFCIVSTLISVEALGATENPTLYMVGQYIRMLLPIATSVGSYAIGFFSDHRSQLDSLKAQRLDLQDLAADTDSAISHAEFAAANFNPDLQDYRFAQCKAQEPEHCGPAGPFVRTHEAGRRTGQRRGRRGPAAQRGSGRPAGRAALAGHAAAPCLG